MPGFEAANCRETPFTVSHVTFALGFRERTYWKHWTNPTYLPDEIFKKYAILISDHTPLDTTC